MNAVFFGIILLAFGVAALRQFVAGGVDPTPMAALSQAMIDAAKDSVDLAIGLVGVMALFLGLMKVAEAGGLLAIIARTVRPLMTRLFPDVPAEHPAMGAMILNISANVLGLGNAATPFGIRAMQELDRLNPHEGTASNAMVLFLAINTSSVTLLATGVVSLRASLGSADPAGIIPSTLFATICSSIVGIVAAKTYQRFSPLPSQPTPRPREIPSSEAGGGPAQPPEAAPAEALEAYPVWVSFATLLGVLALIPVTILYGREIAPWMIPGIAMGLLAFGVARRVRVYEVFVEGAKEGFQVALRIIPYLVAILVAVAMFRASGALDLFIRPLGAVTTLVGMPPEALPMAILRPLSGSGAYGVMTSIMQDPAIGPDSYTGYLVSTLQGSTETTFYVIAVYFGAVQVRRVRHALAAGLTADLAGIIAAVFICSVLFA